MPTRFQADSERTILVIAHPGHELRVHGWLELKRPEVWVLTDGSGRTGRSRIDSTTRVLKATGGVAGPIYGNMTDVDLYQAVLNRDYDRFITLVDQLAATLIEQNIECLAGDAQEGYNPAHDICRLVINAAAKFVRRNTDRDILNYDFTLVGAPEACPDALRDRALCLNLDEAAFARKISAARNYSELRAEVDVALNGSQANNFRVECLRPVDANGAKTSQQQRPFYEEYGEQQVRAGHYTNVLRYREHMLPLAAALDAHVERKS
jgi:hypothetical protein